MSTTSPSADDRSPVALTRLQTLTDCFFALSLLLLVIFIEPPPTTMNPTEENIRAYLGGQLKVMGIYLVTFINIAFYWFFSHNQSRYLRRSDGVHTWLTVLALMFVGLLPFSNALNMTFPESLTVHLFYSAVVFLVGLIFGIDWLYATRKNRLVDPAPESDPAESDDEARVQDMAPQPRQAEGRMTPEPASPAPARRALDGLKVESLVQPLAALLSFGGAYIGTFWWSLPFLLVPVAIFGTIQGWKLQQENRLPSSGFRRPSKTLRPDDA